MCYLFATFVAGVIQLRKMTDVRRNPMTLRTATFTFLGACLLVPALAGCSGDKVEKARRLIDTEPEKALVLLGEATAEKGETFDSLIFSGLTFEKLGRESEAIESYEKALAMGGASARAEPVPERLLALYEKRHSLTTDKGGKFAIARKAADLEKSLKVARPWASTFMLERLTADMNAAGEAGDADTVRKIVETGMDLAVPADAKNLFGENATKALRLAFVVKAEGKFLETLAQPLSERGVYRADGSRMVFYKEFVIPPAATGPDFNPESPLFWSNVRKNTCVPLHTAISDTVKFMEPVLGLKNVDQAGLKVVFENLYRTGAKAGFKAFGGDNRPPSGQTYLCEIDVPLRDFLAAIFVFAE